MEEPTWPPPPTSITSVGLDSFPELSRKDLRRGRGCSCQRQVRWAWANAAAASPAGWSSQQELWVHRGTRIPQAVRRRGALPTVSLVYWGGGTFGARFSATAENLLRSRIAMAMNPIPTRSKLPTSGTVAMWLRTLTVTNHKAAHAPKRRVRNLYK